jgi:hypothetical protein
MATDSYDIRRYLAIFFSAGGSISMTALLAWTIIILQAKAAFIFWIAIGLLILIGLHQTGFISLLVKRSIIISKDEIQMIDRQDKDSGRAPEPAAPYDPYPNDPQSNQPYNQPYGPPDRRPGFDLNVGPDEFNLGREQP